MSKRRNNIKEAEPDVSEIKKKNRALFMAILMILAVGIASAVAAYYVYSSPGGGIDPGDDNPPDDGDDDSGSVPIVRNHMVIGELFVTTTCPYCAIAEDDLSSLEQSRNDFFFVTMVADVNQEAYNRYMEISQQQGTPDTEFDGGRKGELGAVDQSNYINDIEYCKSVAVDDVRITASAYAVDSTQISVTVNVGVPDGTFKGHVRVFVIEKTSRYMNVNNEPIPNAFLGYAINKDIDISGNNPFRETGIWEGDYRDEGNIAIVVAVYDTYGMGVNAYRINL